MNLVTIGISFYNDDKFLKQAIQSVLNQSYKNFSLLLINDGATDHSDLIAKSFTDERIIYINDGKNLGLSERLNQIALLTKTPYLARMDADDVMHCNRIEKQLMVLENDKLIDVIGTNAYSINEKNEIIGIRLEQNNKVEPVSSFIHPSVMGKTIWFQKNKYDKNVIRVDDADLWFSSRKTSKFYCLNEPLLFYREFGSKYYKKYFDSLPSVSYLIKKHHFHFFWIKLFFKQILLTLVYYIFNLFNLEKKLLNNRNKKVTNDQLTIAKEHFLQAIQE